MGNPRAAGRYFKPGYYNNQIVEVKVEVEEKITVAKKPISINRTLTLIKDVVDKNDFVLKNSSSLLKSSVSFPKIIDYTSGMSSIKDQGEIGSCVAFAISAMKEWQENYENKKEIEAGKVNSRKGKEYDYSEAWIYRMCKKIDSWPDEEGTSIRCGMQVLNKIGVPCESAWEYAHIWDQEPKFWAPLIARWALIGEYYRINNLLELKAALQEGPVVMGVPCYIGFFYAGKDGRIPYPNNNEDCYGGHAVCAVGYNDNNNLIKFKNSWGNSWGENGYGYISYDYFSNLAWDVWASKDITVTKEMLKGVEGVLD